MKYSIWYLNGLILILAALLIYIIFKSNWFKQYYVALRLPGPPALPIIGNCLLATDSDALVNLGNSVYETYGPVFRVWISIIPMFVILDPKDLQNILGSSKNTNKTLFYSLMHNFIGSGLITNSGNKWKKNRKLLQPSFNLNILETFLESFSKNSIFLIQKLETVLSQNINITKFINNSVLDILYEAILGIPVQKNSTHINSPFRQGKVATQSRVVRPWLLFDFIFNLTENGKKQNNQNDNIINFTKQIVEKRKEERRNGVYRKDYLSLLERMLDLQEENSDFTDEDVVKEVSTFMLAGQESVATTVSFCLYFLAKHKSVQTQVYEEQNAIFAQCDRMPSMKDLQEMTYLEQCIKETLRLCPSVPLMSRKLGENIRIGKYTLPKGSNVLISPYATQRIQYIHTNPDNFDPLRFTNENMEKRHQFSFIPFSAGPRNCIGNKFAMLEIKTMISTIVRHYELNVQPDYELKLAFRVTLRAKGGIWLKLTSRTKNIK